MTDSPPRQAELGDLEFLEMLLQEVEPIAPGSLTPAVHHTHGAILEGLHRFEDAVQAYDEALKLAPASFASQYRRAIAAGHVLTELHQVAEIAQAAELSPTSLVEHDPFERVAAAEDLPLFERAALDIAHACFLMDRARIVGVAAELRPLTAEGEDLAGDRLRETEVSDRRTAARLAENAHERLGVGRPQAGQWLTYFASASYLARRRQRDVELAGETDVLHQLRLAFRLSRGQLHPVWVRRDPALVDLDVASVVGKDPGKS